MESIRPAGFALFDGPVPGLHHHTSGEEGEHRTSKQGSLCQPTHWKHQRCLDSPMAAQMYSKAVQRVRVYSLHTAQKLWLLHGRTCQVTCTSWSCPWTVPFQ
eukprot:1803199-Amphidinium_carterae.1